jgi:trehalose 6-phosphate synthase/phosphatase
MKRHLSVNTVNEWAKSFVTTLQKPLPHSLSLTLTLNEWHRNRLTSSFAGSKKRLILLDYDGTLVPFRDDYRKAAPPESLLRLLEELGRNQSNEVVVISGRSADDLEKWFGSLPVSLVAEHGASTKHAGARWRGGAKPADAWKKQILPILEKYAARTPRAKIEVKAHSLVWHYRSTPPYYAQKYSVILRRALKPFLKTHGLQIMQGNKVLEIKDPTISKGHAALTWLDHNYDCVIGIGDDITDEELFAAMSAEGYSIKVGRGRTAAHYRVPKQRDVIDLLSELAKL